MLKRVPGHTCPQPMSHLCSLHGCPRFPTSDIDPGGNIWAAWHSLENPDSHVRKKYCPPSVNNCPPSAENTGSQLCSVLVARRCKMSSNESIHPSSSIQLSRCRPLQVLRYDHFCGNSRQVSD